MELTPGARAARGVVLLLLLARFCCTDPGRRDCKGTSNQLNQLGTIQNHYENMARMFTNCTVVLENLEITHIQPHHNLSFLKSIEEVGGYVLIAMNLAETVPLSNLRLIRGHSLYLGQYSLVVMSNYNSTLDNIVNSGVRHLQLSNLTEILVGGVMVTNNHFMCNIDTINWWDIVDSSNSRMLFKNDIYPTQCPKCDVSCVNNTCWAPGPEHCQKYTKLQCADQCSGRCRGPKPIDCCNEYCAAGCTGPKATECLACRLFIDDGTCKESCPPLMVYDVNTHSLVVNPNAKYTYGPTCVKACPHNYVVTDGACVRSCSSGKYEVMENGIHRCKDCEGPCPKVCDGISVGVHVNTVAVNSTNIDSFRNCTKINGNIYITTYTFTGDPHYKIPPMDPSKLENFKMVREITGFLLISAWPKNMTSLSVFENLQIIRGRIVYHDHSLVVMQAVNLRWLGLRSLKEISNGKVKVMNNSELCYTSEDQWKRLFKTNTKNIEFKNNAPDKYCIKQNASCDSQCSDQGCWGPGPSLCVSCLHFNRRGRCVEACNLLQGDPREVEVGGACVQCHSECLLQDGSPTCSGGGPDQCAQCSHYKDGPHCVEDCPKGVLGDDDKQIWKYPDSKNLCQSCHPNCTQECDGPGLSGCINASNHSGLAAAVVGGLLVAVVIGLIVFVFLRRRRITRKRTLRRLLQERELVEPLTPSGQAPNQAMLRVLKETEIKKIRVLGSGAFGTVFKGLWFPEGEQLKIRVAIKVLREATSPKANQEILDEAYVMASVDHPHVCRLLGICLTSLVQLVTQLMPYGCLLDYVRQHREIIGAQRLLNWCVQIAKGMNYLEERHLVHRDLAARNVLVKSPNHVKITDFGLAKLLTTNETEYHADGGKVPIKWMALESILQWTYTHQSDVWSYGVTVWELMTFGSKPYDGIPATEISSVLERGERLPQPPICTIDVYMIMVKCWMIDPSSRPHFRELVQEFSEMARDPHRYLVLQGELPSPSDKRFFSRLLSADEMDEVDAEEYLLPYSEGCANGNRTCGAVATNGYPCRGNSVITRYITDPTLSALDRDDITGHEYMNQSMDQENGTSTLQSDVFNPNYEDLSLGWSGPSLASAPEEGPGAAEYMNTIPTPQNGHHAAFRDTLDNPEYLNSDIRVDNPDYKTTSTVTHNALFLPAAENLEYLGITPVR